VRQRRRVHQRQRRVHPALALVHPASLSHLVLASARPVSALRAWVQERLVWGSHLVSVLVHPVSALRVWVRERLVWVSPQAIAAAR